MRSLWPILLAFSLLAGCARPAAPSLPDYWAVPDFAFYAPDGSTLASAQALKGKVWVANFIFTTCTGPCPRMSTKMSELQAATAAMPDVRLVSFTVDPVNDTPSALADYGRRYKADFSRWFLLTGDGAALRTLRQDAFKLGEGDSVLNHSTKMVLVDRQMRVRGFPDSEGADAVEKIRKDIETLLAEKG